MPRPEVLIGIVLAGGQSSRMGQNKALLDFRGRPLVDYMISLLEQAGCDRVIISGDVPGHDCVADPEAWQGPARALDHLLADLDGCAGALAVPVDMPLLPLAALQRLMESRETTCFEHHPLPAFFRLPCPRSDATSVGRLIDDLGGRRIPLLTQWESAMANLNTPEQWREAVGDEPSYH